MVKCCCAIGCGNKEGLDFVSFYRFPPKGVDSRAELVSGISRRQLWINAVRRDAEDAARKTWGKAWEPSEHDKLCSAHFISGKKSEDPMSPDYVPSVFSYQTSQDKRRGELALERYNRWKESKKGRLVIKKRHELAKSQQQPSVTKVQIEDASTSVSGANIPSDCDTLRIISGMLDCEAASSAALMEERQEQRDEQNAKELHKSTSSPFSCPPINSSDTTPAATFNPEEKLDDDDEYYLNEGSSNDSDDNNEGVMYEDPRTLLLTGKTKELMRLLQVYRKNTIEEHQESSGSRELKANSVGSAHTEQTVGRHVTSFERRLKEQPPKGQQTIRIDGVTYMNVMTYSEEKALVKCIINTANITQHLTLKKICHLVCNFCLAVNVTVPPTWKLNRLAAMEWVKGFMRRHQISHLIFGSKKNCWDSRGEHSGNNYSSVVRENTAGKQVPGLYVCDERNVHDSETVKETIDLDHAYAVRPGTKVIVVKYLKGFGLHSELKKF